MRAAAIIAALGLAGLTAGCDAPRADRPAIKPANLLVAATDREGQLTRARVSTKSGHLLILEPDGSLTEMAVDSDAGRDAFSLTEADLALLGVNLSLDLSHLPPSSMPATAARTQSAQQRALEEFAARTRPLLPDVPAGLPPETFIGAEIRPLGGADGARDDMVAVTANLAPGVDVDVAFAYATCALAGWAETNKAGYARHIRSLSNRSGGGVRIEAIFTLSDGAKPMGLRVMETEDTLRGCADRGIPRA